MTEEDKVPGATLSLGRETAIGFIARFMMAASGFVGVLVFTYTLGFSGMGSYYVLQYIGLVLGQVSAGVGKAIKKRTSEQGTEPQEYLGFGLCVHVLFTALVGLAMFAAYRPLLEVRLAAENLVGVFLFLAVFGIFTLGSDLYAGLGNPGASIWIDTGRSILTLLCQLFLLWRGYGVFGLLLGAVIATGVTGVYAMICAGVIPSWPSRDTIENTASFASWSIPNELLSDLFTRIDTIIIGVLLVPAAAGAYTAADRLPLATSFFAGSVASALLVQSSSLSSTGSDVYENVRNALSYSGLLGYPILFGALVMPTALMTIIFGQSYPGIGLALIGMCLFQLLASFRQPFQAAIEGLDRPRTVFRINLATLAVDLPLAIIGAYTYGLMGVIAGTVLAELVRVLLYQLVARNLFGSVVLTRPMAEQLTSAIVMFIVVKSATFFLPPADLVSLLTLLAIGATAYFTALIGISSHFRRTLDSVLPFTTPYVRS